jgi:hypothetical protein
MSTTPRVCYYIPIDGYVDGKGFRVSVVTENEPGHAPTGTWPYTGAVGETLPYFWGHDYDKATEAADVQNERMGISKRDAIEIVASSMGTGRRRPVNG